MPIPRNPRVPLICEVCGCTIMLPPSVIAQGRRRCSVACMGMAKRKPQTVTCAGCDKSFEVAQSLAKTQKYCSLECRRANQKSRIQCARCGKERKVTPTQLKQGARFCSLECAREVLNKPRPKITCLQCGKSCSVHHYRAKTAKFCSYSCRNIYNMTHGAMASPTSIEIILYAALELLGLDYVAQHGITEAHTIADAYIPSEHTALYADGTYWHALPKVVEKDKRVNARLAQLGYAVHRFTEPELRKNAVEVIRKALGK